MPDPNIDTIKSDVDNTIDSAQITQRAITSITQLNQEIKEYAANPGIGINEETTMAFIADRKWKLNPNGHTKKIRTEIKNLYLEIVTVIKSQKTQIDVISNMDKLDELAKQILTLGLDNTFDYDAEADNVNIGPVALKLLAQEVGHFLVVRGGRVASKHLQTLRTVDQLNLLLNSDTMKD